jgi:hypothetical protein
MIGRTVQIIQEANRFIRGDARINRRLWRKNATEGAHLAG